MTIPNIPLITTTVPTPPNRSSDSSQAFADKADATVAALPGIVANMNATATGMNAAAAAIDAVGVAAQGSATAAATSEAAALGYKNAAAASAGGAATSETNAASSASAAAASAGVAAGFTATSTTSATIGLGAKSINLAQTSKSFVVGDFVVAASTANPANFMTGQVTAFTASTGAMTVNVTGTGGSGTAASWNVALSGQPAAPVTSGTLTGVLNLAPSVTLASAATTDIGSAMSNNVTITGTATITALGVAPEGATRNLTFAGAATLVHNATSLILPSALNISTAAGDTCVAQSLGSGNWRITSLSQIYGAAPGMRAQFDVPPPAPWLPLSGGTVSIASCPVIAPALATAPSAAGMVGAESTVTNTSRFPGATSGYTPYIFTYGAGYYWAIFVTGSGPWTLRGYRSTSPLTGYSLVFTEANVNGGDTTNLATRGAVWGGNQGLFTYGNTLFILEAAGYTRRDDVFTTPNWTAGYQKMFAYGGGKWVAMESGVYAYYGTTVGTQGSAARVSTCTDPKVAWTDRGYTGPHPSADYLSAAQIVFAFGKFHIINIYNSSQAGLWSSVNGYGDWTANFALYASSGLAQLVFDGARFWVATSSGIATPYVYYSTNGTTWFNVGEASTGLVTISAPYFSALVSLSYNQSASEYQVRVLSPGSSMLSLGGSAMASAGNVATMLYDTPNGRLLRLSTYADIQAVTFAMNPSTSFALPTVNSTPPTYIYAK